MSLNIKRIQLTENGVAQDVDILTSADSVTFEDGVNLQDKYDNGDIASADVLGDITDVVGTLNELNESARENTELISELANRGGLTSALRKEVCDGEWKSVSTLPYGYSRGGDVVLDNEMHLLGGYTDPCTQHYKYNGSTWESGSTLPYYFRLGNAVVFDNEIHILGSNISSYYTSHYKWNGLTWESVSTLPYNFYYGGAVIYDNCIHILGGSGGKTLHYKYNGSTWEIVKLLPYDFNSGEAVVLSNEIHILSSNASTTYHKYHYKYNGSSWSSVSTLPINLYYGRAVVHNDEIHIFWSTSHYKYSDSSWVSCSTIPYSCDECGVIIHMEQINLLGSSAISENEKHYSYKLGTYLNGYSKADTQIYLPISTTPITSNLVATDDGYTVTEDGYVEVLLNE